jgi:hypothetical protein
MNLPEISINETIENKLNFFYEKNEIPHIIFHGSNESGKKTIVYNFINKIYNYNKPIIKENVMYVNCSHAKGIKFIREELKFFAKTNLQWGVKFKIIVLLNADSLTVDAQSALRRCIELFSYNTRFFIIVENKNKLLNPILSRFCDIYVNQRIIEGRALTDNTDIFDLEEQRKIEWIKCHFSLGKLWNPTELIHLSKKFHENGISCFDFIAFVEQDETIDFLLKTNISMFYYKIKSEFRCETILLFTLFDFLLNGDCEKGNNGRLVKISKL